MGMLHGFRGMILPTGVSLSDNAVSIGSGVEYQLIPYITPAISSNNKIHWSTNNNNVTVDSNGLVTGVTDGTSVVTATTDYGGYTASCTFTIFTVHVTGITLNESELNLNAGDTFQLEATITPSNATNKKITWRSTDTSIAVVDSNGLITSITDGECQIIATTVDGNYTASCDIVSGYVINENTLSYFPFEEDFVDKKGNRTLTVNDCVIDNGSAKINSQSSYMQPSSTIGGSNITISVWYYYGAYSTGGGWNTLFARNGGTYHHYLMPATSSSGTLGNVGFYNSGWYSSNRVLSLGDWYNIVIVKSGTNEKIYINSELVMDSNSSFDNNSYPIGMIANYQAGQTQGAQGRMSDLIFEQGNWDITKVKKYFNNTKKKYFGTIKDYDELEYIESSGSQYINTLVTFDTNDKLNNMEMYMKATHSGTGNFMGLYNGSYVTMEVASSATTLRCFTGNSSTYTDRNVLHGDNITIDEITYNYTSSLATFIINGTTYTQSRSGSYNTGGTNLTIFARNNNGSIEQYLTMKMYSCYVKIGGEKVRDFMPAKRKSDGEIGLYDKVNGIFYKNYGSGTFTAGPKIGVSLNTNSISLTTAGQTYQLTATSNPSSVGAQGYQWSSSDTTIATVNSTGLVTCVTPGECIITCTAVATGDADTCSVATIEEYVFLSEGGTINKYNELIKSDNNTLITVFDNTTNWIVRCDQTDRGTTGYKVFNEEIIGFNILCQYTENYSYSGLYFRLQDDKGSSDVETGQRIEIHDDRDDYSGRYGVSIYNNGTKIYSTGSTTTNEIRIVGEKNGNDWTITVTGGPSFTYTFTNSAEMHRFSLGGWRWRTGTQGYYKEVIVKLK